MQVDASTTSRGGAAGARVFHFTVICPASQSAVNLSVFCILSIAHPVHLMVTRRLSCATVILALPPQNGHGNSSAGWAVGGVVMAGSF
jgi:hypothetical protein